jgi:hypothetical protein
VILVRLAFTRPTTFIATTVVFVCYFFFTDLLVTKNELRCAKDACAEKTKRGRASVREPGCQRERRDQRFFFLLTGRTTRPS